MTLITTFQTLQFSGYIQVIANFGWNEIVVDREKLRVDMYSDNDSSLYHSTRLQKQKKRK